MPNRGAQEVRSRAVSTGNSARADRWTSRTETLERLVPGNLELEESDGEQFLEPNFLDSDLVVAVREGNSVAFELLLRRYEWLVRTRARRFFLRGAECEDLIQEGMIGLYKAVRDYREESGSFRGFAELCVTRQIITAVK